MITITGYYQVNGTKSELIEINKTLQTMHEVEAFRKELEQQTGHKINFIRKELKN